MYPLPLPPGAGSLSGEGCERTRRQGAAAVRPNYRLRALLHSQAIDARVHDLGFSLIKSCNLSVYWHPPSSRIVASLIKLPLGHMVLDWLPERMIYQRLYALRAPTFQPRMRASAPFDVAS